MIEPADSRGSSSGAGAASRAFSSAALALALCVACGGPAGGFASAKISVPLRSADLDDVSSVVVTVSAADFAARTLVLTQDGEAYSGSFDDLPAGSARLFSAQAFDSGDTLTYQGSLTIDISPASSPSLTILLQQVTTPDPITIPTPQITSVTTSASTIGAGGVVHLRAAVQIQGGGLDVSQLTLAWSDSLGSGGFTAPDTLDTDWMAPGTAGSVSLVFTATAPDGNFDQAEVDIQVLAQPGQPADVAVSTAAQQATLSWDPLDGATSYDLAWSSSAAGVMHLCASVPAPETSGTCSELPDGAQLYLWVRGEAAGEPGPWSAPQFAVIP